VDNGEKQPASPRRGERARLGPALRSAWIGYQRLLGEEMAAAGFGERRFPDGRVLRMCARSSEVTISEVGRELGMTRQGASKIVGSLKDRRLVAVRTSPVDGREKLVLLTPYGRSYLDAQRASARSIERRLTAAVGTEAFDALFALLEALGGDDQPRLRDFLRTTATGPHLE
jgi:DNA-binding MarR family transcriptional regulator